MPSSTVAWMPSHGRHQVNIGPSFGRAIKARKLKGSPAPTTKRSNLPERDFFAFRYNFKPGAIDSTRPASIEVKDGTENTQLFAEFPSKEFNEVCTYSGTEIPAKEVECILIYDEETGQYTLEKLDSVVSLQFGGKRAAAPSAPSTENITLDNSSSSALPAPKLPKSAPKQAKKARVAPSEAPDTSSYVDEEVIEIERPAKKPRLSTSAPTTSSQTQAVELPQPKPPVVLALPGGQSTFVAPPALPNPVPSHTQTPAIPMVVPPGVSANITMEEILGDEEEDDDEDWEAVPTPASPVQAPPPQPEYDPLEYEIFGLGSGEDEEQEIDVNAFEAELNEQMEMEDDGDEDDDMEDVMQEVANVSTNRPISLNRLASGIVEGESDDDYSSSDSDSD